MNTKTIRHYRLALPAILCGGSLLLNSCTTQNTAYQVQTQPMSVDLEKKVLRETGLSGMAVGAAVGAVAGGLGGAVLGKIAGANNDQMKRLIIAGAIAGGASGGFAGYQQGQHKGKQLVASGMSRDQVRDLVKGARAENQNLASFNAGLRKKIASTRSISDPKERKLAYGTLRKQTEGRLRDADSRIALRNKALGSEPWQKDYRTQSREYRGLTKSMVNDRNAMANYQNQISQLDQAVVY